MANCATSIGQTTFTGTYTQNFNSLAATGTSSTLPAGWAFSESGGGANTSYSANTGASTTGNTYSYGTGSNTDRALGELTSGGGSGVTSTFGVRFTNNTGSTITALTISYTGEQWRRGGSGNTDVLNFSYNPTNGITTVTGGTWISVSSLDFNSVNTSGGGTSLDGNLAGNQAAIIGTISGLSIANGATFWIRWMGNNISGSDDGLAIDELTVKNCSSFSGPTIAVSETSGTTNNDGIICEGASATLDAGAFTSYLWAPGGATTQTINVNPSTTTTYTVTVTEAGGCAGTDTQVITVISTAAPTGSVSQTFCSSANPTVADLVATGSNIQWYDMASGGSLLPSGTALVDGTHYYASQTSSGCESISRLDVTATIIAAPSTTGVTICPDGAGQLTSPTICPAGSAISNGPTYPGAGNNVTGAGTIAWSNPSNITANDNSHATIFMTNSGESSNYLQGTDYGFSIPANATIVGIEATIGRFQNSTSGTSIRDVVVSLIKNGTVISNNQAITGSDWPTSETAQSYGGSTDVWGESWTPANINASNFGLALRVNTGTDSDRTGSVDYMQITVYYTLPGSLDWYTVSSGGTSIGSGSPFNPVGVAGSGLSNTNTPGTYTYYVECSTTPGCRAAADFVINPNPTCNITSGPSTVCPNSTGHVYTATGGGTYLWSIAGNGSINGSNTGSSVTVDASAAGTYTITVAVTDNGCTSSCSQTVNVEDNTGPTAICQDITVQLDAFGNVSITAAQIDNSSNDACGIQNLSLSKTSFDCDDVFPTLSNDYAVETDGINDYLDMGDLNNALDFAPKATLQIWMRPLSVTTANQSYLESNSAGNYLSLESGGGVNGGKMYLWANNGGGGTPNAFTVNDVITVNQWTNYTAVYDGTQANNADRIRIYVNGVQQTLVFSGTIPTTLGNLPGFFMGSQNGSSQFANNQYDEVRVWNKALSPAEVAANWNQTLMGNEAGLVAYYTFEDGPGSSTVTEQVTQQSATLNNMDPNTAWVPGAAGLSSSGDVTLTVTDNNGNTSTCVATVTVEDITPPTITCPPAITIMPDPGTCDATSVSLGTPSVSDNCTTITPTNNAPLSFSASLTVVTWSADDGNGNMVATCDQNVTLDAPDFDNDGVCDNADLDDDNDGILDVDECGVDDLSQIGFEENVTPIDDALSATDPRNNFISNYSFAGTDVDATSGSPDFVADIPGTMWYQGAEGNSFAALQGKNSDITGLFNDGLLFNITAAEISGGGATSGDQITISFLYAPAFNYDAGGRESDADTKLGLWFGNGSIANFPSLPGTLDDQVFVGAWANAGIVSGFPVMPTDSWKVYSNSFVWTGGDVYFAVMALNGGVPPGSFDDEYAFFDDLKLLVVAGCADTDSDTYINSQDLDSDGDGCNDVLEAGHSDPDEDGILGTSPVTVNAQGLVTGQGGYTGTNSTVTDPLVFSACNQPPVATCMDITVSADGICEGTAVAEDFDNGSSDPDLGDVISFSVSPAGPYPLGATAVVLTVTDQGGLTSTCDATITVEDNTLPSITCPDNITVYTPDNSCEATGVPLGTATVLDNCNPSPSVINDASEPYALGNTTVTWTVSDGVNNTTCAQVVTVEPYVAPPGSYFDLNTCQSTLCPEGTYCPGGTTAAIPCPAGTSQGLTGQQTCVACPPGYFSSTIGAVACTACAAGEYSDVPGSVICTACPYGTTSTVAATMCTPLDPQEISVFGNGNQIANRAATVSVSDDTDFGTVNVGNMVTRTFTINNIVEAFPLTLSGNPSVEIADRNASDFTVTVQPSTPVASGGSTTFTVKFQPTATGLRSAIIMIASDDFSENPFVFTVQGIGQ
ncbi:MAG: choice-of-anchor D domain-containing protein [Lewinellaceae bacterium]|nr:choice-of-anchor D domain-containing protein [Saprospiraceae bacterium]MCB9329943.1 choice-of-anchor D domain-containing protein [Lewinellaceae bacterium]